MSKSIFPGPGLIAQLRDSGKLEHTLDIFADYLNEQISNGSIQKETSQIVQGYLRQVCSGALVDTIGNLRKAIFVLVFQYNVVRNSAVEVLWDVITVYGPNNFKTAVQYLDNSPAVMKAKIARYISHLASLDTLGPALPKGFDSESINREQLNQLEFAITVVLSSSYSDILTRDWLNSLHTKTRVGNVIYHTAKTFDVSPDVKSLRTLFPQLTIARASQLLKGSSLDQVSQQLLDDPSLIVAPNTKKRFVLLDRDQPREQEVDPDFVAKTLALVQAFEEEDEPDDDTEYPSMPGKESEADRKVSAIEETLFSMFMSNPKSLTKESRNSDQRKKLKAKLNWSDEQIEGWASMVQRDVKLQERLHWRFEILSRGSGREQTPSESDAVDSPQSGTPKSGTPQPEGQSSDTPPKKPPHRNKNHAHNTENRPAKSSQKAKDTQKAKHRHRKQES